MIGRALFFALGGLEWVFRRSAIYAAWPFARLAQACFFAREMVSAAWDLPPPDGGDLRGGGL